MKSPDYYATLDANELAREPAFRSWVLAPYPGQEAFWTSLKTHNGYDSAIFDEARLLVYGLELTWDDVPDTAAEASYARLTNRLATKQPQSRIKPLYARPFRFRPAWAVAAGIALLLLSGVVFWQLNRKSSAQTYQTAYGHIQTVRLPDGTQVTLNANSSLSFTDDWDKKGRRDVFLTGEAYFDVAKRYTGRRMPFVVHTGKMDVVVLGTRFNVTTRPQKTQVVLQEGKVRLDLDNQPDLVMQPGDLVETSDEQPQIRRSRVNADRYVAWRENQLIFDDERFATIARRLQDLYGLQIVVNDRALLEERFTGVTPIDQPDLLIRLLAETFSCQTTRQGTQIVFTPKTN